MIMRTALNVLFDAGNDFEPEMVYEREYKKEIQLLDQEYKRDIIITWLK